MVKTIILIGPPGSGKTSCGQALARLLKWSFVDTDRLIEERMAMSIAEIFSTRGELCFRDEERQLLEKLSASKTLEHFVVGTGGGLPIAHGNFELLLQIGEVVCLQATREELVARLAGAGGRPLLASADDLHPTEAKKLLSQRLEKILETRAQAYLRARHQVETTGFSADEVAAQIVKLLNISA